MLMRHVFGERHKIRSRRKHELAQGMVELTLILPFLLVFAMGIIDFGWALKTYVSVTNSSREGARYGISCRHSDQATVPVGIKQRVADYSDGLLTVSDVSVPTNWCSSGSYPACNTCDPKVEVIASYNYHWITPLGGFLHFVTGGVLPSPLHMSSKTTSRVE